MAVGTIRPYNTAMPARVHISVVIPVYGQMLNLQALYDRLRQSLSALTEEFEIVMVNDASPDNAWEVIQTLCQSDDRVRGINLSKNFGQHSAITAGIDQCRGDWVVIMDCDLQDPPEEIVKLYRKAQEGYDVVFGKRTERNDSVNKKFFSRLFFWTIRYGCGLEHEPETSNFGIYSKRVVDVAKANENQQMPFIRRLHDLGFKRGHVEVEHAERESGKSSYTISKKLSLALDSIISYSNRPLKLAAAGGFIIAMLSFCFALVLVLQYLLFERPPAGWTSVIVSLYFIGGLLMANLGIMGLYIGKVFDVARNKPNYVVQETTFDKEIGK